MSLLRKKAMMLSVLSVLVLITSAAVVTTIGTGDSVDIRGANLLAKSPSTITLGCSSSSPSVNETVHFSGSLNGTSALSRASVTLRIDHPDGQSSNVTKRTDSAGRYTLDFQASKIGTYKVQASYSGNAKYSASSTYLVIAVEASNSTTGPVVAKDHPIRWTWAQIPTEVFVGDSLTFCVKLEVQDANSTWAGADSIEVVSTITSPSGEESRIASTTASDGSGIATIRFTPDAEGIWAVRCDCGQNAGDYSGDSSPMANISVQPPTPPAVVNPAPLSYDYKISGYNVMNKAGEVVKSCSTFQEAIAWCVQQSGKTTYVPAGVYEMTRYVRVASNVVLFGDGPGTFTASSGTDAMPTDGTWSGGTVFNLNVQTPFGAFQLYNSNNCVLKQFRLTGYGGVQIAVLDGTYGGHLIEDVVADHCYYGLNNGAGKAQEGAFQIYINPSWVNNGENGGVVQDCTFRRCEAWHCGSSGFICEASSSETGAPTANKFVRNVTYDNCKAMYCGMNARFNDYVCGFIFGQGTNQDLITLRSCEASYNWMAGIWTESQSGGTYTRIIADNCAGNDNGKVRGSGFPGCGNLDLNYAGSVVSNCTSYCSSSYGGFGIKLPSGYTGVNNQNGVYRHLQVIHPEVA